MARLQRTFGGGKDFQLIARGAIGGEAWKVWLHRCPSGDPCLVHSDLVLGGGGTKLAHIGEIDGSPSPVEYQVWFASHDDDADHGGQYAVVVGGAPAKVERVAVRHRRREVMASTVAVTGYGDRFFAVQLPLGVRQGDHVTVKAFDGKGRVIRRSRS